MKFLLAVLAIFIAAPALAVDGNVIFSGSVASSCSFTNASAGTLTISGTSISSATPGTIDITNNDSGFYDITIAAPTLTTAPNSETISSITRTGTITSGPNTGLDLSTNVGVLANSGTDTLSLALTSGTLSAVGEAGSYVVTAVITCDPV